MLFSECHVIMQSDPADKEGHEYLDGVLDKPTHMRGTVWSMKDR